MANKSLRRSMRAFDLRSDRLQSREDAFFDEHGHGSPCAGCGSTEDAHNIHASGKRYCDDCWQECDD